MFLLCKFAFNIPKENGVFRITFLATELRVIGYVVCFFVNRIGKCSVATKEKFPLLE